MRAPSHSFFRRGRNAPIFPPTGKTSPALDIGTAGSTVSASFRNTMNRGILALAAGTLALGMAEFLTMGILPELASATRVTLPQAGHFISAYALGVCAGAPLCSVFLRHWPLKHILLLLAAVITAGNLGAALAPGYTSMLALRFLAGLPHGAFFGVGSIVAEKLAMPGKESRAVSIMLLGMTVANLAAVPLAVYAAHLFSWRVAYLLTGLCGALTLVAVAVFVPPLPPMPHTPFGGQFAFLKKPAPWLILGVTLLANNGFFCFFSYITPLLTDIAGFPAGSVGGILMLVGGSMCVGNLICGKYADEFAPGKVAGITLVILFLALMGIFREAATPWVVVPLACVTGACIFGVGLCWQVLILRHARGGELMGVAGIQIAFNLGNAIGAWGGGVPLQLGYPLPYTTVPAMIFVGTAIVLIGIFVRLYESRNRKRLRT